ncbi:DUF5666 domain-containing protein [Pseudarthrobacter sp. NS4]|uniref:DUF5666 domain-containing protein n=1 Tax=Pseudarthrobacter sp. NS4 TaxID=2973976 RepID=UPI0021614DBA|nr:DUF5666 domain-containing protein [Pseudarthrobacter sp. NS4]
MPVREPLGFRKAALGGAVALALTGTGVAFAWSASDSLPPAPSSSTSGPGKSGKAPGQAKSGQDKPDKSQRPQHLHGESVVKKADGTFETVLGQRGTVESVSDTSITVRSDDGYTQTYTVNAETRITRIPSAAADGGPARGDDGKRLKPSDGTIADIAAGEVVRISGVRNGGQATAERIAEGAGDAPGLGMGRGNGQGKGHGSGSK